MSSSSRPSGRPAAAAAAERDRGPSKDPGRAYLYAEPPPGSSSMSPAASLQRPGSSASQRSAHSRSASQGSAGQSAAPPSFDPGQHRKSHHQTSAEERPPAAAAAEAAMAALSRMKIGGSAAPSGATSETVSDDVSVSEGGAPGQERCAHALGCIEDAKVALDVLARAIDDAVYLDEDAYAQMLPLEKCTRTIEAQQRCIAELEARCNASARSLTQQGSALMAAQKRLSELQEELENNAVVFKLHYNELLAKDEEIARLRAVVQGLSSGR